MRGDTFAVLLRMIAEAGLGALWMAAPLALLRLGLTVRPARAADHDAGVHALVFTQATLTVFALLALIALFLRADTSVALVAAHSHASKPWLERLADVWTTGSAGVLSLAALAG
ncbi:MAG: heme lyase NrfEFG subunit NrfE, partial [Pseudomonadota bacterium]